MFVQDFEKAGKKRELSPLRPADGVDDELKEENEREEKAAGDKNNPLLVIRNKNRSGDVNTLTSSGLDTHQMIMLW